MKRPIERNSIHCHWNPSLSMKFKGGVKVLLSLLITHSFFQPCYASASSSWSSEETSSSHHNARNLEASRDLSPFAPGSNNLALDLGQVFLMGDLGKYSDSIGTQVHYTYGVSDLFGFDSSFGYSQHANGQFSMLSVLTGLRMNLSWYDKVVPYGVFGVGFYKPSYQDNSITSTPGLASTSPGSVSAVLFGMHLGPGVDLELTRNLFFGAALTLNTMFGATVAQANGVPMNIGGTYTTFFAHFGATF